MQRQQTRRFEQEEPEFSTPGLTPLDKICSGALDPAASDVYLVE